MLLLFFHQQNKPLDTTTTTRSINWLVCWPKPLQYGTKLIGV